MVLIDLNILMQRFVENKWQKLLWKVVEEGFETVQQNFILLVAPRDYVHGKAGNA